MQTVCWLSLLLIQLSSEVIEICSNVGFYQMLEEVTFRVRGEGEATELGDCPVSHNGTRPVPNTRSPPVSVRWGCQGARHLLSLSAGGEKPSFLHACLSGCPSFLFL